MKNHINGKHLLIIECIGAELNKVNIRVRAVLAQIFWGGGIDPSALSLPSSFYQFSETEKMNSI